MSDAARDPFRLPPFIVPSRYDLVLEPDLEQARFDGRVRIHLDVLEPATEIVLNAKELELGDARLAGPGGREVPIEGRQEDAASERVTFRFSRPLSPGAFELDISFRGILNDKLAGFYRSTFTDAAGTVQTLATTQLQATDARRAFPCFDEPAFKAVFGVTLVVPENLFAVSNAPLAKEVPAGPGKKRVCFADTIRMSTYLVAFVVGPLEATAPVDVDGVALRVVHPTGKGHLTAYALKAGAFALRFFSGYYGVPYPAQKLDLVAVPDFAFGAMENLGCVTFREVLLLVDEAAATEPELLRVADVIAHEIAHMWFGDLVTMRWWNGTWLNEAFATFMATACVDAFSPSVGRWDQFSRERSAAFDVDALASTRPIEYPVRSPAEAEGMFDVLTYEKGASVLRMLEQYLGEERFRAGVRHYLSVHAFSNTETHDLWNALEQVTGEPVRSVMEPWIFQGGFPTVSAALDGQGLALGQERFAYAGAEKPAEADWPVPLLIRWRAAGGVATRRELLTRKVGRVDLPEPPEWVVVNAGNYGFYRVTYGEDLRAALASRAGSLAATERYSLVDDAWASVLAGKTAAGEFLAFAEGFAGETDLDVWVNLSGCLGQLERLVEAEAASLYRRRAGRLLGSALARVGWAADPAEPPRSRELRGLLVRSLGTVARDPDACARCRELHEEHLRRPESVEANLAAAAAAVVASGGTTADYEVFLNRCRQPRTPQEERRYRFLLATFPGEAEMARTLEACVDGSVRSQDAPYLVLSCLENRERGPKAWAFVKENWEKMLRVFPDNSVVRMLAGVRALSAPETASDVLAFFGAHPVPKGGLTLQQHLEKLRVNAALRAREAERFPASLLAALQG